MLNEVMKFQSQFAIEDDGFIRVYQDSITDYIVIADVDGLKQFELKDLFKNIDMIFNLIDLESCNREVYFEENGNIKEYINKAIAILVVKEKYERAAKYIDKLSVCGTYNVNKQKDDKSELYCVACGIDGLFAFDYRDLDKVITEQCNYTQPQIIERFTNYDDALNYVREHTQEYDPIECF